MRESVPILTRIAGIDDLEPLTEQRHQLWPEGSAAEHRKELQQILSGELATTFPYVVIAAAVEGRIIGFAEVTLSSRADGCDPTTPIGYLEGWFVVEEWRRRGVGAALVSAFEEWALAHGCREIASDTWIDNPRSIAAHESLGFEEVDRCVNYRKSLE